MKTWVPQPQVSMLLRAAVEELRSRGVEPSLDDICWLYDLSRRQVLPRADSPPLFFARSIAVSKTVTLYAPTLTALIWLDEYALPWWGEEKDLAVTCYALANSKPGSEGAERLKDLTEESKATRVVREWAFKNLTGVSVEVLRWACVTLLGSESRTEIEVPDGMMKPDEGDPNPFEWGEVVCKLAGLYQIPPKEFLYEMTADEAIEMLRRAPGDKGADPLDMMKKRAFGQYRMVIEHLARKNADG